MPEAWTGRLIGKMHNNDISYEDVAKNARLRQAVYLFDSEQQA